MEPAVKLMWDILSPGETPSYNIPEGWRWPILTIGEDGETMLALGHHKVDVTQKPVRRVHLQTFELSSYEWSSVMEAVMVRIEALSLEAGFDGTAITAIRSNFVLTTSDGQLHVFECAMMFTKDFNTRGIGIRHHPPQGLEASTLEELKKQVIVQRVMST